MQGICTYVHGGLRRPRMHILNCRHRCELICECKSSDLPTFHQLHNATYVHIWQFHPSLFPQSTQLATESSLGNSSFSSLTPSNDTCGTLTQVPNTTPANPENTNDKKNTSPLSNKYFLFSLGQLQWSQYALFSPAIKHSSGA